MKAIALLLMITLTGFAPGGDQITWDPDRPLKWSDFRGPKVPGSPHWAATNSGLKYVYGYSIRGDQRRITFQITAYMSPAKSWSVKGKQTEDLLRHEQLHFDISELHARKLRRAVANYEFTEDFETEIKHIYKTILKASRDMQARYDEETDHSQNDELQAEWEEKIKDGLKRMAEWTGHEVVNGALEPE